MKSIMPSAQAAISYVIGLFLIMTGKLSDNIYEFLFDSNSTSGIALFVKNELSGATLIGTILIVGTATSSMIAKGIEKFFAEKISPKLKGHFDRLSEQLKTSSGDISSLLNEKLLENIVATSAPTSIRGSLKYIHEKAYGAHCGHEQGFYTAVNKKFSHFFDPIQPHRSEYTQTVTVVENDHESIKWHEVSTYKIHTVALDSNYGTVTTTPIKYPLKFSSTVETIDTVELSGTNKNYSLIIKINDNTLFDSERDLAILGGHISKCNDDCDWLDISQPNNTLTIRIEKEYDLTEPWTKVEIVETSTIRDDYFISRRNDPTYGANININLPDGWSFDLISFGHPQDWTIHQHPVNTMSAFTRTWLLPGITFFCKWNRPRQSELQFEQ